MSGELTVTTNTAVDLFHDNPLAELIKPFQKEIILLNVPIAGTTHIEDKSVFLTLKEGDVLSLVRENNEFDGQAIKVLLGEVKLGYVPRKDNLILSRLMDGGKLLSGKVTEIHIRKDYPYVRMDIMLIDF